MHKIDYKRKTLERLGWVEEKISQWQKKMQDPKLSTYVEFIKYAKIVTKLSKERKYLLKLLKYDIAKINTKRLYINRID